MTPITIQLVLVTHTQNRSAPAILERGIFCGCLFYYLLLSLYKNAHEKLITLSKHYLEISKQLNFGFFEVSTVVQTCKKKAFIGKLNSMKI